MFFKKLFSGEKCRVVATNQFGKCIDIKQCDEYIKLLQTQGQDAAEFLRSTICYFQNEVEPVVCCPDKSTITTTTTTTENPKITNSSYWPIYPPECGYSPADFNRVVGGRDSQLGNYNYIKKYPI